MILFKHYYINLIIILFYLKVSLAFKQEIFRNEKKGQTSIVKFHSIRAKN